MLSMAVIRISWSGSEESRSRFGVDPSTRYGVSNSSRFNCREVKVFGPKILFNSCLNSEETPVPMLAAS